MDESKICGESMRPHPRVETLGMREPVAHGDEKPFGPDNPPPRSPGRPKGARNKLGGDLKELILQAAQETGFIRKDENGEMIGTGEEGALGYLKWAAIHKADRFIALVSRVMSQHVVANVTHSVMTRAETEARLKECGLPIELLEHLRKAPVVLDDDENEDPYGLNADVTSQDASGVTSPE
jgi:hypothetical protein